MHACASRRELREARIDPCAIAWHARILTLKGLHPKAQGATLGQPGHSPHPTPKGFHQREDPCPNRTPKFTSTSSCPRKTAAPSCKIPPSATRPTNTSAAPATHLAVRSSVS